MLHNAQLLPPPVGTSDWARFSRDSYCVDKTLILKDLIDSKSRVVLFTRPRRFGKTTMLEMIRAFYEPETLVEGRGMVKTEEFFTDKKIWFASGGKYRDEQGKRPVIFFPSRTSNPPHGRARKTILSISWRTSSAVLLPPEMRSPASRRSNSRR